MEIIESKEIRKGLIKHIEVLDKVKEIPYLTDDLVVDTNLVANYFEIDQRSLNMVMLRNKTELSENGLKVLKGTELKEFKGCLQDVDTLNRLKFVSQVCLFKKRTILNVAMLLTESSVAEKVRDYLLNIEEDSTKEQKVEAVKKTIVKTIISEEELKERNAKKLLNKQHKETAKLVELQSAIDKCTLYGIPKEEASYLIQKAIVDKQDIENIILEKTEEQKLLVTKTNRNILKEKIDYVSNCYYGGDRALVYTILADRMRFKIGYNMTANRVKLKKKHGENSKLVPSYLDMIAEYNAFDKADDVLKEIMDEKDMFKSEALKNKKERMI